MIYSIWSSRLFFIHFGAFLILIHFSLAQNSQEILPLSRWSDTSLVSNSSTVRYSGCWGFEWNNKEYAVIGSTEGSHFFSIQNNHLNFIDSVTGNFVSPQAITREYKLYNQFVFCSSDEGTGSFQIIDISYLPDSVHLVKNIRNEQLGKVHNLWVDQKNSLLYACSVTPFFDPIDGSFVPLRVFNIEDPINPVLLWEGPQDIIEVHDISVDSNSIAYLNCGYEGLKIMDFSNPINPVTLQNISVYNEQGYNHQGSLTQDNEFYIFGDETPGKKLKKAKRNTDGTVLIQQTFGRQDIPYLKTPHNIICSKDFAYVAYYNDGLRIYDLRNNPPSEIAHFDTHEDSPSNTFSMWGAWGVFRFNSSNHVIVSDRISGLFLFDFDETPFAQEQSNVCLLFPNPIHELEDVFYQFPINSQSIDIEVFDVKGAQIFYKESPDTYGFLQMKNAKGIYFVVFRYEKDGKKFIETKKILAIH